MPKPGKCQRGLVLALSWGFGDVDVREGAKSYFSEETKRAVIFVPKPGSQRGLVLALSRGDTALRMLLVMLEKGARAKRRKER